MMPRLAGLLATLVASGCFSFQINRRRAFEPVADTAVLELRDRHADLQSCLTALGAPLLVFEQPDGCLALAWGWLDQLAWGIGVSASLRGVAVQFDYDSAARNLEGVVLFFDGDQRLDRVERGLLRDFIADGRRRRRPADVD